ncbi:MAG: hypothetical protein ILM98_11110 [Kiritimatiellae bacterium]|nr:hypothetical protein [Kiritimatiellia bacterium]
MMGKNHGRPRTRIGGLLAAIFTASTAVGAEYWVATNGVDAAGRGSEDEPFLSIQYAVDAASSHDIIQIGEGVFNEGERSAGASGNVHTNRVLINKPLVLQGCGRDKTFIEGAFDPNTGLHGPAAIRCIGITSSGVGTVIRDLTLRNGGGGYVASGGDSRDNWGGGLMVYGSAKNVWLVDCTVSNCVSKWAGGIAGGTAVRCLFTGNRATSHGAAARYANLLNCLIVKNITLVTDSRGVVGENSTLVNCTVAANYGAALYGSGDTAYNCAFFGNRSGNKFTGAEATTDRTYSQTDDATLLFSPATGDYRLTAGGAGCGTADPSYLTGISSYMDLPNDISATIDYYGHDIDTSAAFIDAGCIQGAATPVGGRIAFPDDACAFEVNGENNLFPSACCIYQSETWPETVMARPLGASTPILYADMWSWSALSGSYRWPTMEGVIPLVAPPLAGESQSVHPVFADAVVYAEAGADANSATGSESAPFPTIQGAIDYATSAYPSAKILVLVKPGVYDQGYTELAGSTASRARVVIPDRGGFTVRSTDGAAVTVIKGAPDNSGENSTYYPDCGPASVKCVSFTGSSARKSLQGFTLADGHSNSDNWDSDSVWGRGGAAAGPSASYCVIQDCVITNCTSVRAALYGVWAQRCRIIDCHAYGGVTRATVLAGCFVDPSCNIGTGAPGATANGLLGNETKTLFSTLPGTPTVWGGVVCYDSLFGTLGPGDNNVTLHGSVATGAVTEKYASAGLVQVAKPRWVDARGGDWRLCVSTPVATKAVLPATGSADYGLWASNVTAWASTGLEGGALSVFSGVPLAGCYQALVDDPPGIEATTIVIR